MVPILASVSVDPAKLRIVSYPAPVLRQKASPVATVTDEVRAVAERMVVLMHEAEGIGLAAPQVGLSWRMFVVHIPSNDEHSADATPPEATGTPRVFINPVLRQPEGRWELGAEGCLSLPEIRGEVSRPERITVSALDEHGNPFSLAAGGLLARCLQHETDHLDGVLIIDRMTQMSRIKNRPRVRDLEREAGVR